jgi:hypothetical protein
MRKPRPARWKVAQPVFGIVVAALFLGTAGPIRADSGDTDTVPVPSETSLAWSDQATQVNVEVESAKARLDIYGFAMLDTGYDFKQVDPNWFDVLRPTKLPSFDKQFGDNGNFYAGVRQSRLGFKGYIPTSLGWVKTIFEFELFGTGVDAGQTTFRLRHAWGEIGQFGAGQTWSPFMDPDIFPNSIEYWGPNGMVFFRNVQVRWMPMNDDHTQLWFALERPGAAADQGNFADFIQLQGVKGHFPAPDVSARYRWTDKWGHVQLAGIYRYMAWTQTAGSPFDLSGNKSGWGVNASTNVKVTKTGTIRASVVYGEAIENYMNDAPADIGAEPNPGNLTRPVTGKALPVLGIVGFYDFNWNEKFSSCFGYSRVDIQTSSGQEASAYKHGQYGLANFLYYPVKDVMAGLEFQWGRRENKSDGFKVDDYRIQFSSRFNFNFSIGGNK